MTSSVSHELMTPIKCVITLAKHILSEGAKGKVKRKAEMIASTGKLLETQIKMFLDKSIMENGHFEAQLAEGEILEVVRNITEILQGQANLKKIEIQFMPQCLKTKLVIDSMRI